MYDSKVGKNLIFDNLLHKFGFKLIFEVEKYIITKGGIFVQKGYSHEGMFKLNIIINNSNIVTYIRDNYTNCPWDLW